MKNEETSSTATSMGSHSPSDGIAPEASFAPCGKVAGKPFFTCDSDTFSSIQNSRKSGQRWNTFLGAKSDFSNNLRQWSRKNGNPDLFVRDEKTGAFVYAQKGLSNK